MNCMQPFAESTGPNTAPEGIESRGGGAGRSVGASEATEGPGASRPGRKKAPAGADAFAIHSVAGYFVVTFLTGVQAEKYFTPLTVL